jgi:hypothetical protein
MIRTLACRVREASLYSFGLTADQGPPHVVAEHSSVTVRQQMPTGIVRRKHGHSARRAFGRHAAAA